MPAGAESASAGDPDGDDAFGVSTGTDDDNRGPAAAGTGGRDGDDAFGVNTGTEDDSRGGAGGAANIAGPGTPGCVDIGMPGAGLGSGGMASAEKASAGGVPGWVPNGIF